LCDRVTQSLQSDDRTSCAILSQSEQIQHGTLLITHKVRFVDCSITLMIASSVIIIS